MQFPFQKSLRLLYENVYLMKIDFKKMPLEWLL